MNILITGASGFIGSFLCEEAMKLKHKVWAGIRSKSSRKYLQNEWLNFVTLDMTNRDTLHRQLASFKAKQGRWDVIIHAGGATKCLKKEDYITNNYECTRNFIDTLELLEMLPQQFIYMSSLSVLGPDLDIANPKPNTSYGESKLMSENYLKDKLTGLTIFRPTGVYGPRDKDYFKMVKSIKNHVDYSIGFKPQTITFVYVKDLVRAVLSSIGNVNAYGKIYAISDGNEYSSRNYSDLVQKELGIKSVFHIKVPLFILKLICSINDIWSRITGNASALNNDKYNILSQRNWKCDITPIQQDLGYTPEWDLERGVKDSIKWYKDNKWI